MPKSPTTLNLPAPPPVPSGTMIRPLPGTECREVIAPDGELAGHIRPTSWEPKLWEYRYAADDEIDAWFYGGPLFATAARLVSGHAARIRRAS